MPRFIAQLNPIRGRLLGGFGRAGRGDITHQGFTVNIRVIPRLDIKGPNLVKGINFEGLRVLGKPEHFARYYYENGADELIYMDAVASLYGRNSLLETIKRTASEIFIPLTVGGGLRSLDDIRQVLRAGADKVSLNSAAVKNPGLIRQAANVFGSSTIVVSIEAIRRRDGTYEAYVDYGREPTGLNVLAWAVQAVELGAGEVMVTSIANEGAGRGFDVELTQQVSAAVGVPVIAGGGAGHVAHVLDVIQNGEAQAVALASLLHYHYIRSRRIIEEDYSQEGNIEFLRTRNNFSKVEAASIPDVKQYLRRHGITCCRRGCDLHDR